ncbi:MAG: hypothetical protein GF398_20250 [Chitinivibrionales bacterium]|nr:hypothetical protein [Chitinivibrionales bacterium]
MPATFEVYAELSVFYQKGSVSFIEVSEAQAELLEVQTELIDVQLERLLLFADLYELCGTEFTFVIN